MPINVTTTTHTVTDRRSASAKQTSTASATKWPIVTRTAYERLIPGGTVPDELKNKRMLRLAYAKATLGWAMLALDGALHEHRPTQKPGRTPEQIDADAAITNVLRTQRNQVERAWKAFPLEVVG